MKNGIRFTGIIVLIVLIIAACASGPNSYKGRLEAYDEAVSQGNEYAKSGNFSQAVNAYKRAYEKADEMISAVKILTFMTYKPQRLKNEANSLMKKTEQALQEQQRQEQAAQQAREQAERQAQQRRETQERDEQRRQENLQRNITNGNDSLREARNYWEQEKQASSGWDNLRRSSNDRLTRAENSFNEALNIDRENTEAVQGSQAVRDMRAEIEKTDRQGIIALYSGVAGSVLVNGNETSLSAAAGADVQVLIDNAGGDYEIAVRDNSGRVFPAASKVSITNTGTRTVYNATILNPNPAPNPETDFDIIQNTQGGITITGYKGSRRQVVIPGTLYGITVTAIGDKAFSEYVSEYSEIKDKNIVSVEIPNTITSIGQNAFRGNKKLAEIVIPNSVTVINKGAFSSCGLTKVSFGSALETIGESAFSSNRISEINFGGALQTIGLSAFSSNQISVLSLPASLKTIYYNAFENNKIKSLTIPNGVTRLTTEYLYESDYYGPFSGNPLESLVIPASLATSEGISRGAFRGLPLTRVTLPANMDGEVMSRNFEQALYNFWISQNKAAGTYVKRGPIWARE